MPNEAEVKALADALEDCESSFHGEGEWGGCKGINFDALARVAYAEIENPRGPDPDTAAIRARAREAETGPRIAADQEDLLRALANDVDAFCDEVERSSDLDITAIRARAEAATPGPWKTNIGEGFVEVYSATNDKHITNLDANIVVANGIFIAHAREDIPALCDRVDALEAENAKLKERSEIYAEALLEDSNEVIRLRARLAAIREKAEPVSEYVRLCEDKMTGQYIVMTAETLHVGDKGEFGRLTFNDLRALAAEIEKGE